MKAVREAAVDWCLEKDLHEGFVFRWGYFFNSERCVEKWPHLGSLTILEVQMCTTMNYLGQRRCSGRRRQGRSERAPLTIDGGDFCQQIFCCIGTFVKTRFVGFTLHT